MSHTSFILVGMHLNVNTDNKMLFKRQQGQFHGMHQLTKKENYFFGERTHIMPHENDEITIFDETDVTNTPILLRQ